MILLKECISLEMERLTKHCPYSMCDAEIYMSIVITMLVMMYTFVK